VSRADSSHDALVTLRWWEPALVAIAASAALCAVIVFYDNVHRGTTNGLWKSIDLRAWVTLSPGRWTDGDNMLYYPVVGALVRILPESAFGAFWQRMAFVNAFLGAAVLALTYLIAFRLFGSRTTALFACSCQLAMGFFLLLATINEDIMPGYVWFVAAVACVVVAPRLTPAVIVLTAQCVALSWLFHSSLRLPGTAAVLLGIAARQGWPGSLKSVALFCAALVPLPVVSALAFGLPWNAGLWSWKGLGSGWGGFSINKIVLMWSGIAQSVAGGENVTSVDSILAAPLRTWVVSTNIVILALFGLWMYEGWRRRAEPEWRFAATVLGAAFVLGEGMNLYIQPQDPQMQIQPMTWFPFAAACAFAACRHLSRGARVLQGALVGLVALLFVSNLEAHTATRHADSIAPANARALEALTRPERTMFLLQGFENMATWLTVLWGEGARWPPATSVHPGATPAFNVIYLSEIIQYPRFGPSDAAEAAVTLVDSAFDKGYDVVATDIWAASEPAWVDSFASISGAEKPQAVRATLQARFTGTPIGQVPGWGTLHRLARKSP